MPQSLPNILQTRNTKQRKKQYVPMKKKKKNVFQTCEHFSYLLFAEHFHLVSSPFNHFFIFLSFQVHAFNILLTCKSWEPLIFPTPNWEKGIWFLIFKIVYLKAGIYRWRFSYFTSILILNLINPIFFLINLL